MSNGSGGYDAADAADQIREGDVDANIDGVLSDAQAVANMQMAGERAGLSEDAPLMQLLGRTSRTHTLRQARIKGHVPTLNAATGLSESTLDATGYDMLVNALAPAAQQVLIKGPKGSGKSTKAIDLAKRLYQYFDGELSILTNIEGPDEHPAVDYADTISGMLEWVRDTSGEKLVIGDEWSSEVNAHTYGGGQVGATFSQFINALRKGKGGSTRLIAIGHTHDTDLASILRNQSDVVIEADGKKKDGLIDCATVYEGWTDYLQEDKWFRVRGLQDVPSDSKWGFSTNYFATFDLDLDNPNQQIQKGKLIEDWEKHQDTDDPDGEGEDRPQCQAEKNAGGQCPQGAYFPEDDPVVCHGHRDKLDELTGDGETARDGDEDGTSASSSDARPDARDAAQGAQDALSALQAAAGEREGDEDDAALIARALQAQRDDLTDDEAERMAAALIMSDSSDDSELDNEDENQ